MKSATNPANANIAVQLEEAETALLCLRGIDEAYYCAHEAPEEPFDDYEPAADEQLAFDPETGDAALVELLEDGRVLVAFAGTRNLKQWMGQLTGRKPMLVNGIKAPKGFYEPYLRLEKKIELILGNMACWQNPHGLPYFKPRLLVCGHSRGGTFAGLFALRARGCFHVESCYTFGAPRFLDAVSAHHLNMLIELAGGKCLRFVNNNDPVTRSPGELRGYEHAGQLRYIDHKGWIHRTFPGWRMKFDGLQGRFKALIRGDVLDGSTDHSHEAYEWRINAWESRLLSPEFAKSEEEISE